MAGIFDYNYVQGNTRPGFQQYADNGDLIGDYNTDLRNPLGPALGVGRTEFAEDQHLYDMLLEHLPYLTGRNSGNAEYANDIVNYMSNRIPHEFGSQYEYTLDQLIDRLENLQNNPEYKTRAMIQQNRLLKTKYPHVDPTKQAKYMSGKLSDLDMLEGY